ncbi:MAG: glycosyltransferase family 2 protein [Bacteroidales bacterium]
MSKLAIVILNWNGKHYLERFLGKLIKRSSIQGVSIVIADNASIDGSLEWLKTNYPKIRVIEFQENYGFTGGYNRALKQIDSEYYLLLNSDVEVTEGWIEPLIDSMERMSKVGISMPKIKSILDKESFEYAGASGGFIDVLGYPFCRGRILSNIEVDCAQYNNDREIFWASGAAFMIRSSLFHELGGFDNIFFAHMEEIDLCWRAKLKGWQVWVFPNSVIYHVGGGTLPNNSPSKLFFNYRNNLLMLYKNLPKSCLWFVLVFRLAMDCASALFYLVQGKREFFNSVFTAHKEFWVLKKTIKRDNKLTSIKINSIYRGSIVLAFFFSFKKLRFINIKERVK